MDPNDPRVRTFVDAGRREGRIREERAAAGPPAGTPAKVRRRGPALVEASFAFEPSPPRVVAVVPCEVPSLANDRDWRTRNRVTQAHRLAVSRALGPHLAALAPLAEHYHRGGTLRVVLTRLGGRQLDRMANLGASLKYVEDAVALMLGASDGADNWDCKPAQEPGGLAGVRIELFTEGA
jgi:hypothetical protein